MTEDALKALQAWRSNDRMLPLPAALYIDDALTKMEIDAVLRNEWICVGHVSEVKSPGDYLTFDLLDVPIVVSRIRSGELRAFSNVCAHRSARLLEGTGHCAAIVCPYHSWTYDLEGKLKGAPFMEPAKTDGIRLPAVRIEEWEGLIFATLADDAPPLAPGIETFREQVSAFDIAGMDVIWQFDDEFDCNWKVLVENFCESYHVFKVHRKTLEGDTPTDSVEVLPDGPGFNHHTMDYRDHNDEIAKEHLSCIYPATTLAARDTGMTWLSIQPVSASKSRLRGWLAKNPGSDEDVAAAIDATKAFLAEDKAIVTGVQKGLASGRGNVAPLNPMEKTNWQFGQYLAGRLLG